MNLSVMTPCSFVHGTNFSEKPARTWRPKSRYNELGGLNEEVEIREEEKGDVEGRKENVEGSSGKKTNNLCKEEDGGERRCCSSLDSAGLVKVTL
jgi:hypothetical protein